MKNSYNYHKNKVSKLVIEFIGYLGKDMRTIICYIISKLGGSCPTNSVGNYLLNVLVIEGTALLVTGLEVEYFSRASEEARARTEDKSVLKP